MPSKSPTSKKKKKTHNTKKHLLLEGKLPKDKGDRDQYTRTKHILLFPRIDRLCVHQIIHAKVRTYAHKKCIKIDTVT